MFGSHLSIAGSMVNALHEAERLGFDTVQVFTKNQQQWRSRPIDGAAISDWRSEQTRLGWQDRTVAHASYLINLASPDNDLFSKSLDLMTEELERCEALAIPFLVHHPGSFVGSDLDSGLERITRAYRELFRRTRGYRTVSCLEGTVGAGCLIGGPFEHLARLRAMIAEATGLPRRIGYCLDTCHMHAFGYDLSTRAAARDVLAEFDRLCSLANLKVLHINDSKGGPGSRLDRHAHIGEGTIGGRPMKRSGFAEIMNHPRLLSVPKILETPKEKTGATGRLDRANLRRLRRLIEPVGAVGAMGGGRPVPGGAARTQETTTR